MNVFSVLPVFGSTFSRLWRVLCVLAFRRSNPQRAVAVGDAAGVQGFGLNLADDAAVFGLDEERLVRWLIDLVEHPEALGHELQVVRLLRSRHLVQLLDALGDRGNFLRARNARGGNRACNACRGTRAARLLDPWWPPSEFLSDLRIPGSIALNAEEMAVNVCRACLCWRWHARRAAVQRIPLLNILHHPQPTLRSAGIRPRWRNSARTARQP